MTSHYIQTLGVAKCREILKGMPETATHFNLNSLGGHYAREGILKMCPQWQWFNSIDRQWYWDFAEKNHMYIPDLRAELSAYDTDSCTDIRNHLSPNTVVVG